MPADRACFGGFETASFLAPTVCHYHTSQTSHNVAPLRISCSVNVYSCMLASPTRENTRLNSLGQPCAQRLTSALALYNTQYTLHNTQQYTSQFTIHTTHTSSLIIKFCTLSRACTNVTRRIAATCPKSSLLLMRTHRMALSETCVACVLCSICEEGKFQPVPSPSTAAPT